MVVTRKIIIPLIPNKKILVTLIFLVNKYEGIKQRIIKIQYFIYFIKYSFTGEWKVFLKMITGSIQVALVSLEIVVARKIPPNPIILAK